MKGGRQAGRQAVKGGALLRWWHVALIRGLEKQSLGGKTDAPHKHQRSKMPQKEITNLCKTSVISGLGGVLRLLSKTTKAEVVLDFVRDMK